jgi:hypothetical protein
MTLTHWRTFAESQDRVRMNVDDLLRLAIEESLSSVRCSFFNQSRNFLRPGDVDRVTRSFYFNLVAFGSFGVPPFEVRVNGSVFSRY